MTCRAVEDFGAGRGSGTALAGRDVASPKEAPSEAQAATARPPISVTTNPRMCANIATRVLLSWARMNLSGNRPVWLLLKSNKDQKISSRGVNDAKNVSPS